LDWLNNPWVVGIGTGVAAFFIRVGIQRYWSNHTIASVKRRIAYAEAQKVQLDNLAKSERAVLLFGLGALFAMLGLMNFIFAFQSLTIKEAPLDVARLILWLMPGLFCFYFSHLIQKVEKYPGSLEAIEKGIAKLKDKLLGGR
jgi:hypothetical protein